MRVVGVDGARTGWIAVAVNEGTFERAGAFATFAELATSFAEAACIAVDIPIGLPERGFRAADPAARAFLRGSASRVFPTPPRAVLEAPTHAEAVARARELAGAGISQQSFALRKKIFEVGALADPRVIEVHPEVSFRALVGRALPAKRSWNGLEQRRAALVAAGLVLPADLGAAGSGPPDDVVDAAAAAWSGLRYVRGDAASLPDPSPADANGRPVAIWY